ncbi:MAG: hypothetical protein AVDCRST_MAG89-3183, partial [uncultured Gemmatimonadetes bacterium]
EEDPPGPGHAFRRELPHHWQPGRRARHRQRAHPAPALHRESGVRYRGVPRHVGDGMRHLRRHRVRLMRQRMLRRLLLRQLRPVRLWQLQPLLV